MMVTSTWPAGQFALVAIAVVSGRVSQRSSSRFQFSRKLAGQTIRTLRRDSSVFSTPMAWIVFPSPISSPKSTLGWLKA